MEDSEKKVKKLQKIGVTKKPQSMAKAEHIAILDYGDDLFLFDVLKENKTFEETK